MTRKPHEKLERLVDFILIEKDYDLIDFSMFNKDDRYALYDSIGDQLLELDFPDKASDFYSKEREKIALPKLKKIIKKHIKLGFYAGAAKYHKQIEKEFPLEEIIVYADKKRDENELRNAMKVYEYALGNTQDFVQETKIKDKLLKLANKFFGRSEPKLHLKETINCLRLAGQKEIAKFLEQYR
ncbi:hypothetical protein KY348_06090 [Candidatus Woesearchaeota archaeon]|nr:hypothetical protein [Candidatus Woesearchaeota archaeon]